LRQELGSLSSYFPVEEGTNTAEEKEYSYSTNPEGMQK
jgi:hypothetical protein